MQSYGNLSKNLEPTTLTTTTILTTTTTLNPIIIFGNRTRDFIDSIQLNYLTVGACLLIILITLFARNFKEKYKWFCLNMAVYMVFPAFYRQFCYVTVFGLPEGNPIQKSFEGFCAYENNLLVAIVYRMNFASWLILIGFSYSRCIAVFFPFYYDKKFTTKFTLSLIILSNILILLFISLLVFIIDPIALHAIKYLDFDTYRSISLTIYSLQSLLIFSSVILSTAALIKILIYSYKAKNIQNRSKVLNQLSITLCIFIQNFFLFLIGLQQFFYWSKWSKLIVSIEDSFFGFLFKNDFCTILKALGVSLWYVLSFVDSIVILLVLPGYRKSITNLIKTPYIKIKSSFVKSNSIRSGSGSAKAWQS